MDLSNVPWEKGLATAFCVILLKMLFDAVYKKIPRGFRSVRAELVAQAQRADERHNEHTANQEALRFEISQLLIRRRSFKPRPKKKKKRKAPLA